MARQFTDSKLVIASHNKGKLQEFKNLFADKHFQLSSSADHNVSEPEETGTSFIENAALKALHTARATGLPSLADDSGLCVDKLNDEPGVYSARWAQKADGNRDFNYGMDKILNLLKGETNRKAYFACALALAWPDEHVEIVEGRIYGTIITEKRGSNGFGYDPIFVPDHYDLTFAELDESIKNKISHRADALDKMLALCFGSSSS